MDLNEFNKVVGFSMLRILQEPEVSQSAFFYSLIETAKLKNIDPKQYLIKIATAVIKNPGTITLL